MKVMIVDDDDSIREVLKIMLKDYEVIEARNGREAIELYKEFKPDVVLMDIMLPEIDGISATKAILEIDPKAVVIGISAFAESKGKNLINAGAKTIIEKPFTRKKLKDIIEKYASIVTT